MKKEGKVVSQDKKGAPLQKKVLNCLVNDKKIFSVNAMCC